MNSIYQPCPPGSAAEKLLCEARKYNAVLDNADGGLTGLPLSQQLRTAISALMAGIETQSLDCVCQGCCMLQDMELLARKEAVQ